MTLLDQSAQLDILLQEKTGIAYIRCLPKTPDFTSNQSARVFIFGIRTKVEIDLNRNNVSTVVGMLAATIFDKKVIQTLLAWNIKPLFSYFQHFLPKIPNIDTSLWDLRVIEKFLGIEKNAPENLTEAINRIKGVGKYKNWKRIYQSLHLPLMLRVLPSLENVPLLDESEKIAKYSYYEIEGQRHGRLLSLKKYSHSYLPHNMGDEIKRFLIPKGRENIFLDADINYCEIHFLQWISGDKQLQAIIESGRDLYERTYEILCNDTCNDHKRNLIKLIFLQIVYGMGAEGLFREHNISVSIGKELIDRFRKGFPTAFDWLLSKQNEAKNKGVVEDYFGRPRDYTEKTYYQARNFVVQSPAATVCLEKLVAIFDAIQNIDSRIAFTVHDGYGIICQPETAQQTYEIVKEVVNRESILCPGLRLGCHAKIGRKLIDMQKL